MKTLLPFHTQVTSAWRVFLNRWGSAVALQALTLIPGLLIYPLVAEYLAAVQSGIDPTVVYETSASGVPFLIGFMLLILLGVFIAAGTGILFAAPMRISFGETVKAALVRYIPVLYTSVLAGVAVLITLIPALALNTWYTAFAREGATVSGSGIVAVDAIVLIALVALAIPAVVVAIWVMYAPLATALKSAPAGITSLMFAKHLVHKHVWQLFWRIIGTLVLYQIISLSVSSLPYASFLVPFILTILALAFFVEIYKELQEE